MFDPSPAFAEAVRILGEESLPPEISLPASLGNFGNFGNYFPFDIPCKFR